MPPDAKKYPMWVVEKRVGYRWEPILTSLDGDRLQCIIKAFNCQIYIGGGYLAEMFRLEEDGGAVRCVRCRRLDNGRIEEEPESR